MPTYQYSCTECGHFFEQVQSFSDASLTECPACQGRLRKVFNAVGVVFKGSGFYRNDSRSENGSKTPVTSGASKDGAKESGAGKDGAGGTKDSSSAGTNAKEGKTSAPTTSSSTSGGTSSSGSAA